MYNEVQAVELALHNQLIEAFEPNYLQPLKDTTTDMITHDIPAIISWLIQTYGQVSEIAMLEKEQNLSALKYDTTQPVDFVFNAVNKFCDLADMNQMPVSDRRKCQFAYVILQKSRAFLDSLKKWNARPVATKTYARMKEFMRDERQALEAVGALTIQDSLNQVEMLRAVQQQEEDLTHNMEERMQINLLEALAQYGHMENEETPPADETPPSANSITPAAAGDVAIHRALEALTARIEALANGTNGPTPPNRGNQLPTVNPRTGRPYKRYCWTHGCCTHWSRHCKNKKQGHQDAATFTNRMNGSNKGCLPLQGAKE